MAFILIRTDGRYVAISGSKSSYTTKLENAQTFKTREAAEANRCPDNEHAVELIDVLRAGHW